MPKGSTAAPDPLLLTAALEGLQLHKQRIEEQIRQVRAMLGKRGTKGVLPEIKLDGITKGTRRELSPDARKRIAQAQKKRWAAYRKTAGQKSS